MLRRFCGAALFRGPRPSSSQGVPFWPSGLTLRSSGLAYGQPLTLAVSPVENPLYSAHGLSNGIQFLGRFSALGLPFPRASPAGLVPVSILFGRWPLRSKREQLSFFMRSAASVALRFFAVRARRQAGVSRFGVWV